ncbi:putative ribonuclease H-like domain-containing protein [Tanacetum coccineum]
MDFYLHTNDQISLYRFQAFHCNAIMRQMLYQFQGNQRDCFSNKREVSVAKTPLQNGVTERRNRTLIEAARTMLADSKLPTTFWTEAVNTACYVHNRVLVVKPHNKTPYELFRGRTPVLSFMRPFGCHVTILNTLDYLGKFDGKSDEGFFVGYSLNSKAFRVYNIRTRKVEENLHIRFLEDKPIIAGNGPKWLFDIDVLTKSMNYVPVVAGTNSNDLVDGSLFDSSLKNASNDEPQPSSDAEKKDDESVNKESRIDDQERPKNSTQDVNTARPSINTTRPSINTASTNVNTGSLNINTISPTITTAPLGATHANFFGDETKKYMSNITTTYLVPSTPNTRIHKDHLLDHVIGDVQSGLHIRRMIKTTNEQGFISVVYEGKTHEDLHTCLFSCFLSQEPKKVWNLVDLPHGKRAIGTKWVYRNKKDERVSRIEVIRLFLAHALFKDFLVYQMDVKSAFLYGKIKEKVYVCQPPGFENPEFTNRVYKICLGVDLEPDEWIKDKGCSKHMTGNRKLFSSYKAYNGGQICDNKCRVTFSEHDSEIIKDGKVTESFSQATRYTMEVMLFLVAIFAVTSLAKDKYVIISVEELSLNMIVKSLSDGKVIERRLCHANMCLIQWFASKDLVRNLPKLKFDQQICDACKIGKQAHASHKAKNIVSTTRCLELLHMDIFGLSAVRSNEGNRYTLVIVDDYSRKVEESLNVTFDETPPPSKSSPLVDDDLDIEEEIKVTEKKNLENDIEDETLEIDEIVNIKESRNHSLENFIGNLNQRTLRLVAQGYNQQEGIDCDETYAPVARLESIRILLAYACAFDFKLFQMDVKSAFLHGFINEEVYVEVALSM